MSENVDLAPLRSWSRPSNFYRWLSGGAPLRVRSIPAWERWAFFLFFSFVITGGTPFQDRSVGAYETFAKVNGGIFLAFYSFCAILVIFYLRKLRFDLFDAMNFPICLCFLWAFISISVSPVPIKAFSVYLSVLAITLALAGFTRSFSSTDQLVRFFFTILVSALVINYLTVIFMPNVGVHQLSDATEPGLAGKWRGMQLHKNFAGDLAVLCGLTAGTLWTDNKPRWAPMLYVLVILASGYFAFRAGAKTAMIFGIFILILARLALIAPRIKGGSALLWLSLAIALLVIITIILIVGPGTILMALFGDSTLTGRVYIWEFLWEVVKKHPLFGVGYESLWGIGDQSAVNESSIAYVRLVSNSHNAYLDVLATMGFPGLIIFLYAFAWKPFTWLLRCAQAGRYYALTFAAYWIYGLLIGTTAPIFLKQMWFNWNVFVIGYFGLALAAREANPHVRPFRTKLIVSDKIVPSRRGVANGE